MLYHLWTEPRTPDHEHRSNNKTTEVAKVFLNYVIICHRTVYLRLINEENMLHKNSCYYTSLIYRQGNKKRLHEIYIPTLFPNDYTVFVWHLMVVTMSVEVALPYQPYYVWKKNVLIHCFSLSMVLYIFCIYFNVQWSHKSPIVMSHLQWGINK